MVFIDLLINETTERFDLGNKGIAVISALMATLNRQDAGGVEGFLTNFRRAGMEEYVEAWLAADPNKTITPAQLTAALPTITLQHIADKAKLSLLQTTEVLAFLIPILVGQLALYRAADFTHPNDIRRALWSNQLRSATTAVAKAS
ncbi:MAG: hypothetical protein JST84_06610 [Acidobacteria bacterium]|nr:hypothetical protein [Acidobacteriota bacterium]